MKEEIALPMTYKGYRVTYYGGLVGTQGSSNSSNVVIPAFAHVESDSGKNYSFILLYDLDKGSFTEIPVPNGGLNWASDSGVHFSGVSADGNTSYIKGNYLDNSWSYALNGSESFIYHKDENTIFDIDPNEKIDHIAGYSYLTSDGRTIISAEPKTYLSGKSETPIYKFNYNTKVNNLVTTLEKNLDFRGADLQGNIILFSNSTDNIDRSLEVGVYAQSKNILIYDSIQNKYQNLLSNNDYWDQCSNSVINPSGNLVIVGCFSANERSKKEVDYKKQSKFVIFDLKNNKKIFIKNSDILNKTGLDYFNSPTYIGSIHGIDDTGFSFFVTGQVKELPKNKAEERYFMRYDFEKNQLQAYKLIGNLKNSIDAYEHSTALTSPLARSDIFIGYVDTGIVDKNYNHLNNYFVQKINTGRLDYTGTGTGTGTGSIITNSVSVEGDDRIETYSAPASLYPSNGGLYDNASIACAVSYTGFAEKNFQPFKIANGIGIAGETTKQAACRRVSTTWQDYLSSNNRLIAFCSPLPYKDISVAITYKSSSIQYKTTYSDQNPIVWDKVKNVVSQSYQADVDLCNK
ncbi:hypothetical protein QSV37_04480 [Acinetobacter sp. VNK23]|uniref:hypothetical protein n=1 Tax=Acinetobacter thutiue TaxID=2998078 RepID=UPI002575C411|nr:hypothetical protein [Acinetobacter thutiue]MDM1019568.1 hypothetical protein [Acinetobacter thutiue]